LNVNTLFDDEAQAQVSVWICIILMNILRTFIFIQVVCDASQQTAIGSQKVLAPGCHNAQPPSVSPIYCANISKTYNLQNLYKCSDAYLAYENARTDLNSACYDVSYFNVKLSE